MPIKYMKARISQSSSSLTRLAIRQNSSSTPLHLNPHAWEGLPADRIFELHNLRKDALKENYNPNDDERRAILSTFPALSKQKLSLDYVYEIDNFKERYMNNTPVSQRGLPPNKSNVEVVANGATPHIQRKRDHLTQIMAFEMPLLAKLRQEYKAPHALRHPITLTYNTDFSNESNSSNCKVTLSVKLKHLKLDEKQRKKFMILAGNKFNHQTKTLKFSVDEQTEPTQNAVIIMERFNKLLAASKDLKDDFSDIPVDKRHTKPKKKVAVFPNEWKRPQDAPIARNNIIKYLVEEVKQQKDKKFVSQYTPGKSL